MYYKVDTHKGFVKYGDHWYKHNALWINPLDRFTDAFNQSVDEMLWAEDEADWLYKESYDIGSIIYLMFYGFFDNGASFEKGYAMLKGMGFMNWISEKT